MLSGSSAGLILFEIYCVLAQGALSRVVIIHDSWGRQNGARLLAELSCAHDLPNTGNHDRLSDTSCDTFNSLNIVVGTFGVKILQYLVTNTEVVPKDHYALSLPPPPGQQRLFDFQACGRRMPFALHVPADTRAGKRPLLIFLHELVFIVVTTFLLVVFGMGVLL